MGLSSDLIEKYKKEDRVSVYEFALKSLEAYIERPNSEFFKKNRTNFRFLTREKKVLTLLFIFRILMLAPEEEITGVSEKKTYTIKTVEDAKAYFQRKDKKFIEHLDKSLEQWLNAINEDSTSYSMLSDHPIVVTNDNGSHQHMGSKASLERVQVFLNNQEKIKPILEDPELEDSEISKLRVRPCLKNKGCTKG